MSEDYTFRKYVAETDGPLTLYEIKEQVIAVGEYRCRIDFKPLYEQSEAVAKRQCKHMLLDGLEKFVKTEVSEIGSFVEAFIYLPYVYDSKLAEASKEVSLLYARIHQLRSRLDGLMGVIETFNSMPWYKRLFKKVQI